eukprot:7524520-Ditylum_brightwellii.AAC.1
MGQTIHHEAFTYTNCPINTLAHCVYHILHKGGTQESLLCEAHTKAGCTQITPLNMIVVLQQSVQNLGLHKASIDPNLIGAHSLYAGRAMALKLNRQSNITIMKLGHWSSLTFLMYIHNQIGHLSKDLSSKMRTNLLFVNIAAIN